jgi:hypothetical protein
MRVDRLSRHCHEFLAPASCKLSDVRSIHFDPVCEPMRAFDVQEDLEPADRWKFVCSSNTSMPGTRVDKYAFGPCTTGVFFTKPMIIQQGIMRYYA